MNAGFVAVGLWLRDLILLLASGTAQGQLLLELGVYSPAPGVEHGRRGRAGAVRLPPVVRRAARRMTGFDSYRVGERAQVARWIISVRLSAAARRVLPNPDHPAREVPAQGRDQPAPADSAHAAARDDLRLSRPDHRRERARATR